MNRLNSSAVTSWVIISKSRVTSAWCRSSSFQHSRSAGTQPIMNRPDSGLGIRDHSRSLASSRRRCRRKPAARQPVEGGDRLGRGDRIALDDEADAVLAMLPAGGSASRRYTDGVAVLHMTSDSLQSLVLHRRRTGTGRLDECWEGVWHLTDPGRTHQRLAGQIYRVHAEVVEDAGRGSAWISINVTDREVRWLENHRCPDGAVILPGNQGRWIGERNAAAFWGGPDLVLEILSPGDDSYEKLPFYAERGVREVLIVDPETRRPELWRLEGRVLRVVTGAQVSEVTGLEYSAGSGTLVIRQPATNRSWSL